MPVLSYEFSCDGLNFAAITQVHETARVPD